MSGTKAYIVRDKDIMGGAPVIVGTRIPAERLVALLEFGYTEEKIKEQFPHVDLKKIRGAVSELAASGLNSY
jgi:uncharacterized protein (DUF433 family)